MIEPFRDLAGEELRQIYAEAGRQLNEKLAAEELEKKRARDAARIKEILAEIPKIPPQDTARNFELYRELAELTPQDAKVKQKFDVYRKKFEEQQQKERLAAEKAAKEANERAEIQKKISNQFSAWDGSHRKLEAIIKDSMNDPDSYKHVETRYSNAGTYITVYTTFRGKTPLVVW